MGAVGKVNKLDRVLAKMQGKRVYFDTAPLIYAIENVAGYAQYSIPFFRASEERQLFGFTGAITLSEMLVKPMLDRNAEVVARIKGLFESEDIFTCVNHSREAYVLAAELRAMRKLKMVDALLCATAICLNCDFFVTNDFKFRTSSTLEVVCIDDLVARS